MPAGVTSWWAGVTGGLPRPFWVLWAGTIVNRLGQFVEPFLALYLVRGRGLSLGLTGLMVTCFGAGSFLSQPLGGWLADRIGRRRTMVGGLWATSAALGLLAISRPLWAIGVTAALTGLATDLYRPAASAAVADLVPAADRPRAFALVYWAINLGVSVSGVLGGVLATHGWWLLFTLDALTTAGFAVLVARGVPETAPEPEPDADPGGYRVVFADRLAVALSLLTFVSGTVYLQAYIALPLAMSRDGLSPAAYGLAYAVNPVVVLLVQPLTLRRLSRLPPTRVYASSAFVLGVGFGLTALAHSIWAYAGTVVVWTLGEIAVNAVGPTIVNTIAPASLRGRYNGLIGLAFGAAALVAPLAGAHALAAGRWVVWGGCFVVSVACAGCTLALGPALRRRMATTG
jgi:MFS family permease